MTTLLDWTELVKMAGGDLLESNAATAILQGAEVVLAQEQTMIALRARAEIAESRLACCRAEVARLRNDLAREAETEATAQRAASRTEGEE